MKSMLLLPSFQGWWETICLNHPAWMIELGISIIVMVVGFWIPATVYQLIDLLFPGFSASHKLQADSKQKITGAQIRHCIAHAAALCLVDIAVQVLFSYLTHFRSIFAVTPALPSVREVAIQWIYAVLAYEVLAYYLHRAFHHPLLYVRFHKKHHSFTAPIAFSNLYTTLTEHFLLGVLPVTAPLAYLSANVQPVHILSFATFLFSHYLLGTAEHSGYDFAQLASAKAHDLHHEKFKGNYGTLHFMDWMHGTDLFRADRPDEIKRRLVRAKANKHSISGWY